MIYMAGAMALLVGARELARRVWWRGPEHEGARPSVRTIVDPMTSIDCETLLRSIANPSDPTDVVAAKLVRLFVTFEPRERSMQRLSLVAQAPAQPGDAYDFAVCTVYSCMMLALMGSGWRHARVILTRSQSETLMSQKSRECQQKEPAK